MKINIDLSSKPGCCDTDPAMKDGPGGCSKKCRNRALIYLSLAGIVFLLSFVLGYLFPSSITRIIWLTISGTLVVLTGISAAVVIQSTTEGRENACCSDKTGSKTTPS